MDVSFTAFHHLILDPTDCLPKKKKIIGFSHLKSCDFLKKVGGKTEKKWNMGCCGYETSPFPPTDYKKIVNP